MDGYLFLNETKEPKMTREEAVNKFYNIMYTDDVSIRYGDPDRSMKWAKKAIAAYEALGLIKFDAPLPKYVFKDSKGVEFSIQNEFVRIEK